MNAKLVKVRLHHGRRKRCHLLTLVPALTAFDACRGNVASTCDTSFEVPSFISSRPSHPLPFQFQCPDAVGGILLPEAAQRSDRLGLEAALWQLYGFFQDFCVCMRRSWA